MKAETMELSRSILNAYRGFVILNPPDQPNDVDVFELNFMEIYSHSLTQEMKDLLIKFCGEKTIPRKGGHCWRNLTILVAIDFLSRKYIGHVVRI